MGNENGILAGVRVLDFGRYVAGPWCAQLLQGMGAEVVRVERPGGAEDRPLFPLGDGQAGSIIVQCNRGKRSFTLNPSKPAGREVTHRLLGTADVVIANLPAGTLRALGLDWATVSAANPRVVLGTATTFGEYGPYAGRLGFDGIGQAMSGAVHLAGRPGDPMKSFVPWVDFQTATTLAFGVMAALFERTTTGVGRHIEASLLGTALTTAGHTIIEQAVEKTDRAGTGNRHNAAGPSDIVATRDGFVQLQVVGNAMFARWCDRVGRPDLASDPRFATDTLRGANGEELSTVLQNWCATRTTAQVLADCAELEIPAGPVLSPQAVLEDPHVRETALDPVRVPGVSGDVPAIGHPLRVDGARVPLGDRLAVLGEDTDAILRDLGYGDDEIAALRTDRVI